MTLGGVTLQTTYFDYDSCDLDRDYNLNLRIDVTDSLDSSVSATLNTELDLTYGETSGVCTVAPLVYAAPVAVVPEINYPPSFEFDFDN